MNLKNTSKPIIHIARDEKFIDAAHDIYEQAFPGKNRFIILLQDREDEINYLSKVEAYEFLYTSESYLAEVHTIIDEGCIVIFHGMKYDQSQVALSIKKENVTLVWSVFGSEVYGNPYLVGNEIYGAKTYKTFVFTLKRMLKNALRPYYRFFRRDDDLYRNIILAMRTVDYVAILHREELLRCKDRIKLRDDIKQLPFTYYPMDVIIDRHSGMVSDNNILLGNSAYYSNNHLEAFDLLKMMGIGDRKIICPLSYGNEAYADEIAKRGNSLFGAKFHPLAEFLPLSEYQKILRGCGIVIMNHYRQQGAGNILHAMHLGAKVYLSRKNSLYQYLTRIGCQLYCIEEDLKPDNKNAFRLLTKEQIQKNRTILERELSLDRICSELQQKFNPLLN
ncbi:4-alpha-L-fucosyltransferase glycosyl transferase group 56 [Fodinibius roseus]|uniref:4-alpha-L-fucosyltransferase glycosyl transferase group 56 n=1 Tax=Fodinibius roseus TaxID=1194090 RepID=A0A1M5F0I4_9BACT|nr:TDP-N-acetylfucosamine:lipid II N-acetylfucosaminyltransferase [Fodinibius roseus]SHF85053.1 4-alpha-L-fucosyltransferase glycosyl transferase group 56 [Fodinibius roseus]